MATDSVTYTLTPDELAARMRRRLAMEPVDDSLSREDSPGAVRRMALDLRAAYLQGLFTLPAVELPLTDLSTRAVLIASGGGHPAELVLPPQCVRVVSVKLNGWARSAIIVSPDSAEALAQDNPFSRASTARPVAVADSSRRMRLYTPPVNTEPTFTYLLCVALPDDNLYLLTPPLEDFIFKTLAASVR